MDESNLDKNFGITSGVLRTMNDSAETPPFVRDVMSAPNSVNLKKFLYKRLKLEHADVTNQHICARAEFVECGYVQRCVSIVVGSINVYASL